MKETKVQLGKKTGDGFVIPLGDVNLVFVRTDRGMIGCGAFDVIALEKFGYPAAKVRPKRDSVRDINDLMEGEIAAVNPSGEKLGIRAGMSGKEALNLL